jgi:hypothetical protein
MKLVGQSKGWKESNVSKRESIKIKIKSCPKKLLGAKEASKHLL